MLVWFVYATKSLRLSCDEVSRKNRRIVGVTSVLIVAIVIIMLMLLLLGESSRRRCDGASSADDFARAARRRRVSRPRHPDSGARKPGDVVVVVGDVTSGLRQPAGALRVRRL